MQNYDSVHSTDFVINNLLKIDDLNVIQPQVKYALKDDGIYSDTQLQQMNFKDAASQTSCYDENLEYHKVDLLFHSYEDNQLVQVLKHNLCALKKLIK